MLSMNTPLRIGTVGAGFIAGVVAAAIRDSASAVNAAVASRRRESADALAAAFAIPHAFDTWQELVASDTVDAVYVATPTVAREEICLAAAAHGKHVLGDKPFASAESVRRIAHACQDNGVAFLDATHFVHHPRHRRLLAEIDARIGATRLVHTSFFFPNTDRDNIRLRPDKEPTGAVGDMAWYCMRAVAEFTPMDARLDAAHGFLRRDPVTGGVIRCAGVLRLDNGCMSTWEAGYDTGACVQDLAIQGERGMITQDDYVLDWASGIAAAEADYPVAFVQRAGVVTPRHFETVPTPAEPRQAVRMIDDFAALCADPLGDAAAASIRITERTQSLVDAIWEACR